MRQPSICPSSLRHSLRSSSAWLLQRRSDSQHGLAVEGGVVWGCGVGDVGQLVESSVWAAKVFRALISVVHSCPRVVGFYQLVVSLSCVVCVCLPCTSFLCPIVFGFCVDARW